VKGRRRFSSCENLLLPSGFALRTPAFGLRRTSYKKNQGVVPPGFFITGEAENAIG